MQGFNFDIYDLPLYSPENIDYCVWSYFARHLLCFSGETAETEKSLATQN